METLMLTKTDKRKQMLLLTVGLGTLVLLLFAFPSFAAEIGGGGGGPSLASLIDQMINIVGTIFVAVGIILAVYSVGQLTLAFKNEDADSKSRASTMLVVSVVLITFPTIIKNLNLTQYL